MWFVSVHYLEKSKKFIEFKTIVIFPMTTNFMFSTFIH